MRLVQRVVPGFVLGLLLGMGGCGGTTDTPPEDCIMGYPSLVAQNLQGTWYSTSGTPSREYEFAADASFVVRDLVAPCPAGSACVWSGIITNTGTWVIDRQAETVALTYKQPMQEYAGLTFPSTLSWSPGCHGVSLVESDTHRAFTMPVR